MYSVDVDIRHAIMVLYLKNNNELLDAIHCHLLYFIILTFVTHNLYNLLYYYIRIS